MELEYYINVSEHSEGFDFHKMDFSGWSICPEKGHLEGQRAGSERKFPIFKPAISCSSRSRVRCRNYLAKTAAPGTSPYNALYVPNLRW